MQIVFKVSTFLVILQMATAASWVKYRIYESFLRVHSGQINLLQKIEIKMEK